MLADGRRSPRHRAAAGQAGLEVAERKIGDRIAPGGGNGKRRSQHEIAIAIGNMRHGQPWRGPGPAAPKHQIEIKHARGPALSAAAPAEVTLNLFEHDQQFIRRQICLDDGRTIGIASQRWAKRGAGQGGCSILDRQARISQRMQRRAEYCSWPTVTVVALVRAKRDQIALA